MLSFLDRTTGPFRAVLCLTALFTAAHAQEKDDVIRVDTELAAFEVTVTDRDGRPIRDLKAGDFRVFEDGVERPVDFFQPIRKQDENRPLSVVFAVDVSGSMTAAGNAKAADGAAQLYTAAGRL